MNVTRAEVVVAQYHEMMYWQHRLAMNSHQHGAAENRGLSRTPPMAPMAPWGHQLDANQLSVDEVEKLRQASINQERADEAQNGSVGGPSSIQEGETVQTSSSVKDTYWKDQAAADRVKRECHHFIGVAGPHHCPHEECQDDSSKVFPNTAALLKHYVYHLEDGARPFVCVLCACDPIRKDFALAKDAARHAHTVHGVEPLGPFVCDNCSRTFARKDGLQKHKNNNPNGGCTEKKPKKKPTRRSNGSSSGPLASSSTTSASMLTESTVPAETPSSSASAMPGLGEAGPSNGNIDQEMSDVFDMPPSDPYDYPLDPFSLLVDPMLIELFPEHFTS